MRAVDLVQRPIVRLIPDAPRQGEGSGPSWRIAAPALARPPMPTAGGGPHPRGFPAPSDASRRARTSGASARAEIKSAASTPGRETAGDGGGASRWASRSGNAGGSPSHRAGVASGVVSSAACCDRREPARAQARGGHRGRDHGRRASHGLTGPASSSIYQPRASFRPTGLEVLCAPPRSAPRRSGARNRPTHRRDEGAFRR